MDVMEIFQKQFNDCGLRYYDIKVPILTHVSSNNKTLSNSSAVVAMLVGRGSLG